MITTEISIKQLTVRKQNARRVWFSACAVHSPTAAISWIRMFTSVSWFCMFILFSVCVILPLLRLSPQYRFSRRHCRCCQWLFSRSLFVRVPISPFIAHRYQSHLSLVIHLYAMSALMCCSLFLSFTPLPSIIHFHSLSVSRSLRFPRSLHSLWIGCIHHSPLPLLHPFHPSQRELSHPLLLCSFLSSFRGPTNNGFDRLSVTFRCLIIIHSGTFIAIDSFVLPV